MKCSIYRHSVFKYHLVKMLFFFVCVFFGTFVPKRYQTVLLDAWTLRYNLFVDLYAFLVPVPCCFYYCHSVKYLEIWLIPPKTFFFFSELFWLSGNFSCFHLNFRQFCTWYTSVVFISLPEVTCTWTVENFCFRIFPFESKVNII